MKLALLNKRDCKCEICGYNKCIDALEFHHKNPEEKDFSLSNNGCAGFEKLLKEFDKCIVLCANCHREIHFKEYEIAKKESGKVERNRHGCIKVDKYDLYDKYICSYNSMTEAAESCGHPNGVQHIGDACRGKKKTAYNFKWKFRN